MHEERIYTGPVPVVGDPHAGEGAAPGAIFLLADSQPLFAPPLARRLATRMEAALGLHPPRAAYLGASNGDDPDFYGLFLAAVEPLGPAECRMVTAALPDDERAFLEAAELILLAGGDVERGWRAFEANGTREIVERRHREGAVVIGVSAGAVQLGTAGWPEGAPDRLFPTWGFAPFVVGAHEEDAGWAGLHAVVSARGEGARGVGLPRGAAAVLHPDGSLEALGPPLHEVRVEGDSLASALILPPGDESA